MSAPVCSELNRAERRRLESSELLAGSDCLALMAARLVGVPAELALEAAAGATTFCFCGLNRAERRRLEPSELLAARLASVPAVLALEAAAGAAPFCLCDIDRAVVTSR